MCLPSPQWSLSLCFDFRSVVLDFEKPKMDFWRILTHFVVALLLIQDCLVWGSQMFEQQPQYTEVNPSSDVILTCKVKDKRGTCSWQKNNKPVGMHNKKYEWAGSQEHGDCSIWIRSATLRYDDGLWECQVTASDFTTQDALTSTPVRLVVRNPPQPPFIEFNNSQVMPARNVTAKVGDTVSVKCISRNGNPPPILRWVLGDEDVTHFSAQKNATESDNEKTWMATSIVTITLIKEHHTKPLRCLAVHELYDTKSQDVEVKLNVLYPPEVELESFPKTDLEEGKDHLRLHCRADANPPAKVTWERVDRGVVVSSQEELKFLPISRDNAGNYTCMAKNSVGSSSPISVSLDVKYGPKVTAIQPRGRTTASLHSNVSFTCDAVGNPEPSYQWLQKLPMVTDTVIIRGNEKKLHLYNVTYEHQGQYVCMVTNIIGNSERAVQSESVEIKVEGAPQILRSSINREVGVIRGENALLRMVVCADPKPTRILWQWGSVQLESGGGSGRFLAEDLSTDERKDCYAAKFRVQEADMTDSRTYHLTVENDRGKDMHGVLLAVREPVSMTTLLSVVSGCLLLVLFLVLLSAYAVRREKCCFARRGDFRPADLESEKSDVDSTSGKKTPRIDSGLGNNAVMSIGPDHHYGHHHTAPAQYRIEQHIKGSPEAMKDHDYPLKKAKKSHQSDKESKGHRHRKPDPNDYQFSDRHRVLPPTNNGAARLSMMNSMNQSANRQQGSPPLPETHAYFLPSTQSLGFNDHNPNYFHPNSFERAEI